ncbi:Tn7-like element transposition protein TnsE [Salinispira pacifica]|uniref:Transposon Tn7 transposition protein tnsE n=1 Tax=Salinispira pacifica TaxID=1307761 RepID=V5WJV5_9SPIO|nr:Tn7-like element transposition protein TnsE [Salinispira pacifica]AHC16013.1 Transposon Tn7 transposition protein tnsE [Salinispira pacifica]
MKLKGIAKDSTVYGIGSFFRSHRDSDWKLNINLRDSKSRGYAYLSEIHLLARRRILNPSHASKTAGYKKNIFITDAREWKSCSISDFELPGISSDGDGEQLCFVFDYGDIKCYLPQFELARALFFNSAYLSSLSMKQNGLAEEFDISVEESSSQSYINILPNSNLPSNIRRHNPSLQHLSWLLFDKDARRSYESIFTNIVENSTVSKNYRKWNFRFDPPSLKDVKLIVHGRLDKDLKVFFGWEIHSISNLKSDSPAEVEFIDPKLSMSFSGGRGADSKGSAPGAEIEIDNDQTPNPDQGLQEIEAPQVKFQFRHPIAIRRSGRGKKRTAGTGIETDEDFTESSIVEVSTNESSVFGAAKPAEFAGIEILANDVDYNHVTSFTQFNMMINKLCQRADVQHISSGAHPLPALSRYSKYCLDDGSDRLILSHHIKLLGNSIILLEVDTFDCPGKLSTLLLKRNNSTLDSLWEKEQFRIECELVKQSLNWPTDYLNNISPNMYIRVKHPRLNMPSLQQALWLKQWPERIHIAASTII